jgi:hypothetical protein
VQLCGYGRAVADCGGNSLHRAGANISGREHTNHRRLSKSPGYRMGLGDEIKATALIIVGKVIEKHYLRIAETNTQQR